MHRPLRLAGLTLAVLLAGCGPSTQQTATARAQIHTLLSEYLPKLAQAYATQNAKILEPMAAEKEVSSVQKRIGDLQDQGRVLKPELTSFTIEDVQVWNTTNAYVTTVEIWDLHVYASGTDTEVSKELQQSNRVKYQLSRENGNWIILYRTILR